MKIPFLIVPFLSNNHGAQLADLLSIYSVRLEAVAFNSLYYSTNTTVSSMKIGSLQKLKASESN